MDRYGLFPASMQLEAPDAVTEQYPKYRGIRGAKTPNLQKRTQSSSFGKNALAHHVV
jgi:hypothetical protein